MKSFGIFYVVFLAVGLWSVTAQDLVILREGSVIEAKVMEISPTEIRYKRFDYLDGPTVIVPTSNVLSIRYENGKVESINASSIAGQKNNNVESAIDQNKFIFGINANAGGALSMLIDGNAGGPGINIELGKGRFNGEINLMFPLGGFGALFTFNGFFPSKIGGFYLGGGIGFLFHEVYSSSSGYIAFSLPVGGNIGYKFVTKSGLFFRTGIFVGFDFGYIWSGTFPVCIKPDLAIGWTMK